MDSLSVSSVVDSALGSFCIHASIQTILPSNCSLFYLHSNDMNSDYFYVRSYNHKYIRYKKRGDWT